MTVTSTTISFELSVQQAYEALNALEYRRHAIEQSIRDIQLGHTLPTAEDRERTLEGLRRTLTNTAEAEQIVRRAFYVAAREPVGT